MASEQDPSNATSKPSPAGEKVIGIDLGTTFSCVAHIDEHNKAVTIPNQDAQPSATTPSAVLVEGKDEISVGKVARDSAVATPENVITLVKREMGKPTKMTAADLVFTPEEVSAMILKKLKQDAERYLNLDEAKHVVITVPAFFGQAERKATQDAGEMAGFIVHQIISEPVAAALAFGFSAGTQETQEKTMLVYDLGGGTFDVTLFKLKPTAPGKAPDFEMIGTGGNHDLGGANWDELLVDYVAEEFMKQAFPEGEAPPEGVSKDPRDDPASKQDLMIKCEEQGKIPLKKRKSVKIVCQHAGKSVVVQLDQDKLLELTDGLLQMTETEIDSLLSETKYTEAQIDEVLLVGGSTKLNMVNEMLEKKFPGKLNNDVDPDQCVAHGAAWMGHLLSQGAGGGDDDGPRLPGNRASHALGIAALDERNQLRVYNLILRNQEVPCTQSDSFYTEKPGQTAVQLRVYENAATSSDEVYEPDDCRKIGEIVVDGLPPGRPGNQQLDVTFHFDASYALQVTAKDVASGKTHQGELDVTADLSDEERVEIRRRKDEMKKRLPELEIQS